MRSYQPSYGKSMNFSLPWKIKQSQETIDGKLRKIKHPKDSSSDNQSNENETNIIVRCCQTNIFVRTGIKNVRYQKFDI